MCLIFFNLNFWVTSPKCFCNKLHKTKRLTLSWRRFLSYKNQSTDLLCKSIDFLPYVRDLRHERVNRNPGTSKVAINFILSNLFFRSNARQQSLQDALDRLLLFHKNMISALTWLSSAESKVAELDSLVEASQTEESTNVQELQKEMRVSLY